MRSSGDSLSVVGLENQSDRHLINGISARKLVLKVDDLPA